MANTAFIYIEGEICPDFTNDVYYDYPHTSLTNVRAQLAAYPGYEEIRVTINSPGGVVTEGFAIHDFLKSTGKKITTIAIGQCCSIATAIFMVGQSRLMTENAQFMVHLPSGWVYGNVNDVESYLELLKQDTDRLVGFYAETTGKDSSVIAGLMAKETYMTAQECVDNGFATGIYQPVMAKAKAVYLPVNKSNSNKMTIAKTKEGRVSAFTKALQEGKKVESKVFALASGETLDIDTVLDAPSEGDKVRKGGEEAPDGTYELGGDLAGVTVAVKGGIVDNVVVPDPENSAEGGDLQAQIKALKEENETLKGTVKNLETNQTVLIGKFDALLGSRQSADINTTPSGGTVKNRADATPAKSVQDQVLERARVANTKQAA